MATQLHVPKPIAAAGMRPRGPVQLQSLLPRPVTFVMAGGGAHGCVQWGLLQALAETDITPDALIGTSAGSLTCAIVGEDPLSALSRLSYVWSQLDLDVLVGDSWMSILSSATKRRRSLADNTTERETLESILVARAFEELQLPAAAVATDLATGKATAFDSGDLVTALLASSAIPGMLPPVTINGRYYIDGLASANLPARLAVERGAGTVIVLDTGSREPVPVATSPTKVVARVNGILNARQRSAALAFASTHVPTIVLPTPQNLGAALNFRGTMSAASASYELARTFLADLAAQYEPPTGATAPQLETALYARRLPYEHDPDLREHLCPVESGARP